MALVQNTAETGLANGTTVTIANSDDGAAGTAFAAVNSGITFSTTQKAHGALSYGFAGTAATFNVVRLDSADGTTTGFSTRFYLYLTTAPSAETNVVVVQTSAGVAIAGLNIPTTLQLKVVEAAGAFVGQYTNALSLNTWYRITLWGTISATTAQINSSIYALDNGTAIETKNYTNRNTGSAVAGRFQYGKLTQAPSLTTYYIDDIAQDADRNTEIGAVSNTPPTVDAGSNLTVAAGGTANLSATASDPDGTIASHNWTFDYPTSGTPTLTGGTTATPSFTVGSAGSLYVLRDTVTDNGGLTAFDTVEVRVPTTGNLTTLVNYPPTTTGTWTVTGAANDGAALSDGSDSTYVESPAASVTTATRRWRLTPSTTRSAATITVRLAQDVAGSVLVTARVYSEGVLLETFTPVTISTTITDRNLVLGSGAIAAVTDWGALYLEVSMVAL